MHATPKCLQSSQIGGRPTVVTPRRRPAPPLRASARGALTAIAFGGWIGLFLILVPWAAASPEDDFTRDIRSLAAIGDRSTGSPGNRQAAALIRSALEDLEERLRTVRRQSPGAYPNSRY